MSQSSDSSDSRVDEIDAMVHSLLQERYFLTRHHILPCKFSLRKCPKLNMNVSCITCPYKEDCYDEASPDMCYDAVNLISRDDCQFD